MEVTVKTFFVRFLAFIGSLFLAMTAVPAALAQSATSPGSLIGQQADTLSAESPHETALDPSEGLPPLHSLPNDQASPFADWGIPTPPGAENYRPNQVAEEALTLRGVEEWHPTPNPNNEVLPGKMRSDREPVPEPFTKADGDTAEIHEALPGGTAPRSLGARSGCSVYWPSWFKVCGAIKTKYDSIGGPTSFLNFPKSAELTNPDGIGKDLSFSTVTFIGIRKQVLIP